MITYSIIKKSELEGALRLDAEYYQPEYLEVHNKIDSLGIEVKLLKDVITKPVITGSTPKIRDCKEDGTDIKFIKTDTLREGEIIFEDADCLPIKSSRKHSEPQLGDVLVTIIGATHDIIGRSAMVFADDPKMNINQNIVLIRVNTKLILPSFLEAFLQGKFGRDQLWQQSRQTEQVNLNCREVELVKIPVVALESQKNIDSLVNLSRKLKNDAIMFYQQAEDLLLQSLGLSTEALAEVERRDLSYMVNLSDIKSDHRADAEFFQPKYETIFEKINKPIKNLLELTTFLNHAKQPFYVEDGEVPIVTQKHLGQVFLNTEELKDSETKFTGKEWLKNYPSFKLKKGDLLYYSVGAYIGKTNVILNDLEATAASFLTIIRAKNEIDPVYLTVVLNSVIGQLQSEKWQSATAQQYIYPKDIKNFKIPILPKSTQQKIAELVRKSHEARKKSKELLEGAKRKVETSIETQSKRNDRKRRQIKRGQPVIYK